MIASKIKIRHIKIFDLKKIYDFLLDVDAPVRSVFCARDSVRMLGGFISKVHSNLPIGWKFLQEGFVALENNKIVGLVSLVPESRIKLRWKIDQLYLRKNSFDVGKLLVDFVVNKYGAEGIETFIADVDSSDSDALELFKKACGFRYCTKKHSYKLELSGSIPQQENILSFKSFESSDNIKLYDLYLECLTPQTKISLEKTHKDFSLGLTNSISNHLSGLSVKRWVLELPDKNQIIAYADIITRDNKVFKLNAFVALPYADYYEDLLHYVIRYIALIDSDATLYVDVCEAIQSYSAFIDVLKQNDFEFIGLSDVIVKDYWRPLKERQKITSPIMIFPEGTSTAYNQSKEVGQL